MLFFATLCMMHAAHTMEVEEHEAAIESAGDMFSKAQEERETKEEEDAIKAGVAGDSHLSSEPATEANPTPQVESTKTGSASTQKTSDGGEKIQLGFFDKITTTLSGHAKTIMGRATGDASWHTSAAQDYTAVGDHENAAAAHTSAGDAYTKMRGETSLLNKGDSALSSYASAASSLAEAGKYTDAAKVLIDAASKFEKNPNFQAQVADIYEKAYDYGQQSTPPSGDIMKLGTGYDLRTREIGELRSKLKEEEDNKWRRSPIEQDEQIKSYQKRISELGQKQIDAYQKLAANPRYLDRPDLLQRFTQFNDIKSTITKSISIDQQTQADTPKATPAISTETATTIKPDDAKSSITAEAPADVTTRTDATKPKTETPTQSNSTEIAEADATDTATKGQKPDDAKSSITIEAQAKISEGDAYIKAAEQITLDSPKAYADHAEKMSQAGDSYADAKDFNKAAEAYKKALRSYDAIFPKSEAIKKSYQTIQTNLAQAYIEVGNFREAGSTYSEVADGIDDIKRNKTKISEFLSKSAEAYSKAGDHNMAKIQFEEAARKVSGQSRIDLFEKANAEMLNDDYKENSYSDNYLQIATNLLEAATGQSATLQLELYTKALEFANRSSNPAIKGLVQQKIDSLKK
jgi:tetratricopeptide (TPR) repeat protein